MAMYRQLPAVHPVYKVSGRLTRLAKASTECLNDGCLCSQLLIPHVRYTIAINTKAREELICECGIFDKVGGVGDEELLAISRQHKGAEFIPRANSQGHFFFSSGKRNRRRRPHPAGPERHEVAHLQDPVLPGQHQGSRPGHDGRGADLLLQRRRLQSVGRHQEVTVLPTGFPFTFRALAVFPPNHFRRWSVQSARALCIGVCLKGAR